MADCACSLCKSMCRTPCWPTFDEAKALINKGFSDKLMLDFYEFDSTFIKINILCPAHRGKEGKRRSYFDITRCVFQNDLLLCDLHNTGLKPKEGRIAICTENNIGLREEIAHTWLTTEAQNLVNNWVQNHKGNFI